MIGSPMGSAQRLPSGRSSRSPPPGGPEAAKYNGRLAAMRIALIVSEYHAFVTDGLERGAREALSEQGIAAEAVERFAVPGAFELAQAASRVAASGGFAAVICLGCLIRGETAHCGYIAQAASQGIMGAAHGAVVPVSFGLLTTGT